MWGHKIQIKTFFFYLSWCEFISRTSVVRSKVHVWWILLEILYHSFTQHNRHHEWADTESICRHSQLTQLVEVSVTAVGSWYRADQTGLEECRPLVDQTSLTAHVILVRDKTVESKLTGYYIENLRGQWQQCYKLGSSHFHHFIKLNFF